MKWTFIPEGATEEQPIPEEAETSAPPAAPATAYLYYDNPEKRHEGQYVCRVGQAMDIGRLIIEDKSKLLTLPITVFVYPSKVVLHKILGQRLV